MSFQYTINKVDTSAILQLKGKLLGAEQLNTIKEEVLKVARPNIIVDCEALKHINSTGINFFIQLLTKARINGGELILCNIKEQVTSILNVSKMDEVFTITSSTEEAQTILKSKE